MTAIELVATVAAWTMAELLVIVVICLVVVIASEVIKQTLEVIRRG